MWAWTCRLQVNRYRSVATRLRIHPFTYSKFSRARYQQVLLIICYGPKCPDGWQLTFGEGNCVFLPAIQEFSVAVLHQKKVEAILRSVSSNSNKCNACPKFVIRTIVSRIWGWNRPPILQLTDTGRISCYFFTIPLYGLYRDAHCRLLFERKTRVVKGLPMNNAELRKDFVHARCLIFIRERHLVKPFRGLGKKLLPS